MAPGRRGTHGGGLDRVRSHVLVTPSGRDHGLAPGAPKGQPPRNLSGIRDWTGQASLESARRAWRQRGRPQHVAPTLEARNGLHVTAYWALTCRAGTHA